MLDVPPCRPLDRLPGIPHNLPTIERAVDSVEPIGANGCGDAPDLCLRKGDEIGVAVHEAHRPAILDDLYDVTGEEHASAFRPRGPVEHRASGEMAAEVDQLAR